MQHLTVPLDRQEIVNAVFPYLLQQGKAYGDAGCCYRTPDKERACAIGVLISDELYPQVCHDNGLERDFSTALSVAAETQGWPLHETFIHAHFFERLQGVHDGATLDLWEETFRLRAIEFCQDFGLYNPLVAL